MKKIKKRKKKETIVIITKILSSLSFTKDTTNTGKRKDKP